MSAWFGLDVCIREFRLTGPILYYADSPLAMGRLTGKYSAANPPPSGRRFSNIPMDTLEPLLGVMRRIAKTHDVPVSAVALGWVMAKGAIPLGGARNKSQAEQVSGLQAQDAWIALDI